MLVALTHAFHGSRGYRRSRSCGRLPQGWARGGCLAQTVRQCGVAACSQRAVIPPTYSVRGERKSTFPLGGWRDRSGGLPLWQPNYARCSKGPHCGDGQGRMLRWRRLELLTSFHFRSLQCNSSHMYMRTAPSGRFRLSYWILSST